MYEAVHAWLNLLPEGVADAGIDNGTIREANKVAGTDGTRKALGRYDQKEGEGETRASAEQGRGHKED